MFFCWFQENRKLTVLFSLPLLPVEEAALVSFIQETNKDHATAFYLARGRFAEACAVIQSEPNLAGKSWAAAYQKIVPSAEAEVLRLQNVEQISKHSSHAFRILPLCELPYDPAAIDKILTKRRSVMRDEMEGLEGMDMTMDDMYSSRMEVDFRPAPAAESPKFFPDKPQAQAQTPSRSPPTEYKMVVDDMPNEILSSPNEVKRDADFNLITERTVLQTPGTFNMADVAQETPDTTLGRGGSRFIVAQVAQETPATSLGRASSRFVMQPLNVDPTPDRSRPMVVDSSVNPTPDFSRAPPSAEVGERILLLSGPRSSGLGTPRATPKGTPKEKSTPVRSFSNTPPSSQFWNRSPSVRLSSSGSKPLDLRTGRSPGGPLTVSVGGGEASSTAPQPSPLSVTSFLNEGPMVMRIEPVMPMNAAYDTTQRVAAKAQDSKGTTPFRNIPRKRLPTPPNAKRAAMNASDVLMSDSQESTRKSGRKPKPKAVERTPTREELEATKNVRPKTKTPLRKEAQTPEMSRSQHSTDDEEGPVAARTRHKLGK